MTLGEENTSHQDYAVSSAGCNTTSLKASSKRHTRRIPVVNGQGHAGLVSQRPACKGLLLGGSAGYWEWLRGGAWGGSPLSGLQNSPLPPCFLIDMQLLVLTCAPGNAICSVTNSISQRKHLLVTKASRATQSVRFPSVSCETFRGSGMS